MRYQKIFLINILLLTRCFSQEPSVDSSKIVAMKEVVVTATRSAIPLNDSPSKVDLYTSDRIQSINATSVADVVETSGSIFLKDYGIYGALKTASIRGSASEEVLVLLNGSRLNNFENNVADLGLLPIENIERIEVLYGGNSAVYGSDALGGVVNIITRQPSDTFHVHASASGGSYGYQGYMLGGETGLGNLTLSGGYGTERGRDNYPFILDHNYYPGISQDLSLTRSNADFLIRHGYVDGQVQVGNGSDITFYCQQDYADRGVPGSLDYATSESYAREEDNNLNTGLTYNSNPGEHLKLSLRSSFQYNYETYLDPNPPYPINSFYKNNFASFNPQADILISSAQHLTVGIEVGQATLKSSDFQSEVTRVQKAVYASHEMQFEFHRSFADKVLFYESLRYDDISDVDASLTPKLGLNIRMLESGDIHIRSSIGRSFRSPTFNDLYYPGASNPNLKPEHSTSFDVGFTTRFRAIAGERLECSYFLMNTTDQILFDPMLFVPVNIGRVDSRGVEISGSTSTPDDRFTAGIDYTYISARNKTDISDSTYNRQLIYQPKDILKCRASFQIRPLMFTFLYMFTGERFTTESNRSSLPGYRIANANILLNNPFMKIPLTLKAEVNNVFDKDYQVYPHYPMPKRTFRVTARYDY
jgi:vitamin B12 transporter